MPRDTNERARLVVVDGRGDCPMCGSEIRNWTPKPFPHDVACRWCGERVQVPGDPQASPPNWDRPFWSDQFVFRVDNEPIPPADLVMYAFVAGLALVITFASFLATQ